MPAGDPGLTDAGFGVYIHWPFCLAKCPYCDFNSHVHDTIDQARWRNALRAELAHYAAETPEQTVTSIFFGGGTPSLMAPETVSALITDVRSQWPVAADLEITLEANPTSVEAATFPAFKTAGVNRVSVGVQSLRQQDLSALGRRHSVAEARTALERAATTFQRFSFDLIYARPGQTVAAWRDELDDALTLAGGHLSVYQLTIEPGTAFFKDGVMGADPDTGADLYDLTQDRLGVAGLPAYEISNHAAPGEACRHNLTYWRGGDYVGIGPGAHGRLTTGTVCTATHQVHDPARWLELTETQGHGTAKRRQLSAHDRATELIMMGLRLTEGIDRARFRGQTARDPADIFDASACRAAIGAGYLDVTGTRVAATADGRLRLNSLLSALLAHDPEDAGTTA